MNAVIRIPDEPGAAPVQTGIEERGRAPARRSGLSHLILHLHPRVVPEKTLNFSLTFGLGGLSVVLLMLLVATGVLLLFAYEPSAERAYDSVLRLRDDVPFGQFVRNLHRWGANLAVVLVFLHLLRVFFTGAYRPPRSGNWIVGCILGFLILASNFTGYLLPWDQLSYWAVTICTSMLDYVPLIGAPLREMLRGGSEIGPRTLSIFFVLHIVFLPITMVALLMFHFWLVRKSGGVVIPRAPGEVSDRGPMVPVSPNLTVREGTAALVLLAGLFVFALLFDAPLGDRANPGLSPNPAKAPWYFMGLQELLIHFHPFFAVVVLPLAVTVLLLALPYVRLEPTTEGVWFLSTTGRRLARTAALLGASLTLAALLLDEYVIDLPGWLPGVPPILASGVLPVAFLAMLVAVLAAGLRRHHAAARQEMAQAVFVGVLVAFVLLTAVGIGCRGRGMALVWPWSRTTTTPVTATVDDAGGRP